MSSTVGSPEQVAGTVEHLGVENVSRYPVNLAVHVGAGLSSVVGASVLAMAMETPEFAWPTSPMMINSFVSHEWSRATIPSATGWTPDQLRSMVVVVNAQYPSRSNCDWRDVLNSDFVSLSDFVGVSDSWEYFGPDSYVSSVGQRAFGVEPRSALSDLGEWTSLPTSRLGELLGVARRSIYNWTNGRPVRPEIQTRLGRVHDVLRPVAAQYEPDVIRQWLGEGRPTNFDLIAEQQWSIITRRTRELLEKQKVRRVDETEAPDPAVEMFADPVRAAVFAQFSARPQGEQARRADWVPREITGLASYEDEDDE